jgi:CelD/BcsL family acetyltransferase involved in cellulose biosynthesis
MLMEDLSGTQEASQQVCTAHPGTVELFKGEKVFEVLAAGSFQAGWDALYAACPWGTVFQSRDFVASWYHIYHSQYQPVLVRQVTGGRLTGLLTLARDKSGLIMGAGDSQAEYQVWLTADTREEDFIQSALAQVRRHFPGQSIRLKYLPGNTPLAWISREKAWQKRCLLRACKQPLLRIDEDRMDQELKKKNRREKLNRLKKMGELRFERVTDYQVFSAIFDELATQYDFRKGAMFNRLFFLDDPFRKEFLLTLFQKNLLHTTILRLNDDIIASNVGATGKNWVHLQGINTHAPSYSRYSPGILHFLMLGKLLAGEGIEVFDLTPGVDPYKDTLASDSGMAYELHIGNSYSRFAGNLKNKLVHHIKVSSSRVGVSPEALRKLKWKARLLKEKVQNARQQGLKSALSGLFTQTSPVKSIRVYRIEPEGLSRPAAESITIYQGSLQDLLKYDQQGASGTRWEFLAEAMRRFESGDQCYTWSEAGRLLGCAWLGGLRPSPGRDLPNTELPEGAAVLEGFYFHPAGRGHCQAFLKAVVAQVARDRQATEIFALAPAGDAAICQSVKAAGFVEVTVAIEQAKEN